MPLSPPPVSIESANAARLAKASEFCCDQWSFIANFSEVDRGEGNSEEMNRFPILVATPVQGSLRLLYANVLNSGETLPTSAITIRVGIEAYSQINDTLVPRPVYFNGIRDVTLQPGQYVLSDPISPFNANAGDYFFLRHKVICSTGTTFVVNGSATAGVINQANANYVIGREVGSSLTDKTLTGTVSNASNGYTVFGPLAVFGAKRDKTTPNVIIEGHSIAFGIDDRPESGLQVVHGYLTRACVAAGYSYCNLAKGADLIQNIAKYENHRNRDILWQYGTDLLEDSGINDWSGGRTLANIKQDKVNYWLKAAGFGMRVFTTSVLPSTTSSDSWATVGNQTVGANASDIASFNNWLRDGAPFNYSTRAPVAIGGTGATVVRIGDDLHPVTYYIDTADMVESARDSGKWKAPGYTTDGLHPNSATHIAMAAAINLSSIMGSLSLS